MDVERYNKENLKVMPISLRVLVVFCCISLPAITSAQFPGAALDFLSRGVVKPPQTRDEAKASAVTNLSQDDIDRAVSDLLGKDTQLEKRSYSTRKFTERDEEKILSTLHTTLESMGFNGFYYDSDSKVGEASSNEYQMTWYVRSINEETVIRVSLIKFKSTDPALTEQEYLDFWNSLGKVQFLENVELSKNEL